MEDGESTQARRWLVFAVAVGIAASASSLGGDFVLDDVVAIEQSRCVTEPLDLPRIVGTNFWCEEGPRWSIQSWRPLTVLAFWGLWHLGASPMAFGVLNLVLHGICIALVARLGRQLGISARAVGMASVLFGSLAIHVDAVAPAVGAAELLSAALVLAAVCGFVQGRWWFVVAGVAAVLSKESGVLCVPLTAAALLFAGRRGGRPFGGGRRAWTAVLALALGVFAVLWWRASVLGAWTGTHIPAFVNPLVDAGATERVMTGLAIIGRYHRITLAGGPLSADYAQAAIGIGDDRSWTDFVMGTAAVVMWILVFALGRRSRSIRFLAVWALGTSAFVSNIVLLLPALFAERLFYLPSVAVSLLAGIGIDRVMQAPRVRPMLPRIGFVGFVVAQIGLSIAHGIRFRDERTIIEHTVETTPRNARARMWLAVRLLRDGDLAGARIHADTAQAIRPQWGLPLAVIAALDDLSGRPRSALDRFRRAMELDPQDGEVANLFIQFLLKYGHHEPARQVYATHARARGGADPGVTVP